MYYHSNGDVQTPGWNRLTQDLIDNGTYITGSDTSLSTHGKPSSLSTIWAAIPISSVPTYTPLYIAMPGCGACTDATHTLDSGLGTTHLDWRTVYIAPGVDFSNTITHTGFVELAPRPGRWRHASVCRALSIRCRMTVLSLTAFPPPIAP